MTPATGTVTTVIFAGRPLPESVSLGTREDAAWSFAYTDEQRRILIEEIKTELAGHERQECAVYSWDRPCQSMMEYTRDDLTGGNVWMNVGVAEFPPQGLTAVAEHGHGALVFHVERDGGSRLYFSDNHDPFPSPPVIRYDTGGGSLFPRRSVFSLGRVHTAVEEYVLTGRRPVSVGWTEIRRSDLPRLDPRW
jgi:hypothetical protein